MARLRRFHFRGALCISLCIIGFCGVRADNKPTVASISLCTDRLVMALADRGQIVSLSYVAADSKSMIRTAAESIHLNRGRLEELLALEADYILASEFNDARLLGRLSTFGKDVIKIVSARTLDQAKQNIRSISTLLGQPARGLLMIRKLDGIGQLGKNPARPRTLLLGANYYISGKNTLASSIIEIMGYRNIAHLAGILDYGQISIEQIIKLNPQVIIISKYSNDYSRAQSVLRHPVMQGLSKRTKIIYVPTREWICGDEALLRASKRLVVH